MADDALDKARAAEGTHTPNVEVDPTNELLDGDNKPLPPDLANADVVVDESGTRLTHVDPDVIPSPTQANLEVLQREGKLAAAAEADRLVLDRDRDTVRALREEYEGLARRAEFDDNKKLKSRITQIKRELKNLGATVADDEQSADDEDAAVKEAAQERKAAVEATGQTVATGKQPAGRRRPPAKGTAN